MKMRIILSLVFMFANVWAQDDVFLEVNPNTPKSEAPVEDLPPNEPPYTKTQDEMDAQQLLNQEQPPADDQIAEEEKPKEQPLTQPVHTETSSDSGRKKIAHPDAKKGLYLIDQNTGRYYYKTQKLSSKNQATSIRVGSITPPNITMETGGNTYSFVDIYSDNNLPYLMLDYEWQPFRSFGKLGVVMGVGFFTASGNGRFANPAIENGESAKEQFTFIGLPISAGGIYRLEFSDRQWFAPFVVGGMSYYVLGEIRDDGKAPKVVGTPAGYAGGGVLFNITRWSREIDFIMDREYGINNMWLAAEFRTVQSLNEDLDVSADVFNIGISVDY
ncbi:MAG: hypothetical protein JNM24_13230 [Bdellovibrionaceae bacterium]|nr:hypothetical protein [Pseudobdellovibrionaceae bacterium]